TLMYFGAHGAANGLDNIIRAMGQLRHSQTPRPIRLRLGGDGPLKGHLIAPAQELDLETISFEPPVPKREIARVASQADAFIFNLIDAPVFKYGISSNKLFDFMACGRPVVFSCNAPNNPIESAGGGITVPPGDSAALVRAIIGLEELPA